MGRQAFPAGSGLVISLGACSRQVTVDFTHLHSFLFFCTQQQLLFFSRHLHGTQRPPSPSTEQGLQPAAHPHTSSQHLSSEPHPLGTQSANPGLVQGTAHYDPWRSCLFLQSSFIGTLAG